MTSFGVMLRSERGNTSPSFLIAILVVVALVAGFFGWRYLSPNPHKRSEQIVRESRGVLSSEVRDFEQALRDVMAKGSDPATRLQSIEKSADEAKKSIDGYVDQARSRLSDLEIPLKKYQNRAERIGQKADDAKRIIDERVAEKRSQISGG